MANNPDTGWITFEVTLDEISKLVQFLELAAGLRPRLGRLINWNAESDLVAAATAFMKLREIDISSQFRGMVVIISGAFENLVRRIVYNAVDKISKKTNLFDDIDKNIQARNIHFSGLALCYAREPLDHHTINTYSIAKKLATCCPGATTFELNTEAFSMQVKNLTPSHLIKICETIGIDFDWDFFGKLPGLDQLLGTKGARNTGKAASDKLGDLISIRNRVAHTGSNSIIVTSADINNFVSFFKIFGHGLIEFVDQNLSKPNG